MFVQVLNRQACIRGSRLGLRVAALSLVPGNREEARRSPPVFLRVHSQYNTRHARGIHLRGGACCASRRSLARIAHAIRNVEDPGDVVVLAQASMAKAAEMLRDYPVPILSSPRMAEQHPHFGVYDNASAATQRSTLQSEGISLSIVGEIMCGR